MKKLLKIFLYAIIAFHLTGYFQAPSVSHAANNEYLVKNVVDGDTIELSNGKIVRYIGIDTPEVRKKILGKWQYAPEPFAIESKKRNEKLVGGKKVRLEFDKNKEDKYGRWLAYVYVGDKIAAEELLKEGLAIIYFFPENKKYSERFASIQLKAMEDERGLWGECEDVDSDEADDYMGNVCRVRGRVLDTYRAKNVVFLNFGAPKKDFTAVIFSGNLRYFEKQGIAPARDYRGKYIEVSGKIKEHKGSPEIVVSHPVEIKVLQ